MMTDAYGPVDFLILEYPSGTDGTATAHALRDLVHRGVVALYDLMVVRREPDGTAREIDLTSGSGDVPPALAGFAGARSGLLGADDVAEAANALEPGTSALVLVYENRWAAPFVSAARAEGVEVVASARLTAREILDALDEVEAAS
jgi:uncharacterized membrane protein